MQSRRLATATLVLFQFLALSLFGQTAKPLTNTDVVKMVKGGLPGSVVISAIQSSPATYDISPDALLALQKAGVTYSGIAGFAMQDSGIQELMGPIVDRTKENLVSTDNGIIMARHRLMRAAKALVEKGETPPGVEPAHQRVRSVAIVLPPDQAFKDAAKEEMQVRPGLSHARV